jgi:hypothetical protein
MDISDKPIEALKKLKSFDMRTEQTNWRDRKRGVTRFARDASLDQTELREQVGTEEDESSANATDQKPVNAKPNQPAASKSRAAKNPAGAQARQKTEREPSVDFERAE